MPVRTSPLAYALLLAMLAYGCAKTPSDAGSAPPRDAWAAPGSVKAPATVDAAAALALGPPPNLNVLLITVDCLRADMPWAGYDHPIAPYLTALEQRAVSYTHAYSLSSYTSMSVGGLLGGRYPGEMKRDGYFFGTYRDNVLFPERLHAAGIRTVTAHAHL